MYRIQCLDCRQVLSGRRHSYTEYVYCEGCCRYKLQRLQAQLDSLRAAALKAAQQERELRLVSDRSTFLSTWSSHNPPPADHGDLPPDPIPPFTDVALRPSDGPCVLAHRAFLAGKSPAFKAMFCNPDAQGGSQTEGPITVNIDDMSHEVLRAFVRFFYTAAVDSEIMEKHSKSLYLAAEKYKVELLKTMCEEWITKNLSDHNALSNLELAKQYNSDVVKDAVLLAASLHVDKIPSYAEYQAYVEKDPGLLLELYEGSVKIMTQKRRRKGKHRYSNFGIFANPGLQCQVPFHRNMCTD